MGVKWFVTSYLSFYYFHQNSATLKCQIQTAWGNHTHSSRQLSEVKSLRGIEFPHPAVAIFCWWLGDQPTVYVWTWQVSQRHQIGKLQGLQGLGDVKRGGKFFFYFLIHLILFYFIIFFLPFDRPVGACPSHRQSG